MLRGGHIINQQNTGVSNVMGSPGVGQEFSLIAHCPAFRRVLLELDPIIMRFTHAEGEILHLATRHLCWHFEAVFFKIGPHRLGIFDPKAKLIEAIILCQPVCVKNFNPLRVS